MTRNDFTGVVQAVADSAEAEGTCHLANTWRQLSDRKRYSLDGARTHPKLSPALRGTLLFGHGCAPST
eukprot:4354042-Pyramimonas_sp.AAC.1